MIAKNPVTSQQIRQNLLGCLEIALFMRKGAGRFGANKQSMMRSFAIPFFFLPLTILIVVNAHPADDLSLASMKVIALIYSLRLFVYLGVFLAFVYMMSRILNIGEDEHQDVFYSFATANNWLMIPAAVLMAPLVISFLNGGHEWGEIYPLMVFIALYAYAYTAFMAAHVLRIPMELAGFIAIAGMAINQSALSLIKQATVGVLQFMA